jgi:hypothetical protein
MYIVVTYIDKRRKVTWWSFADEQKEPFVDTGGESHGTTW